MQSDWLNLLWRRGGPRGAISLSRLEIGYSWQTQKRESVKSIQFQLFIPHTRVSEVEAMWSDGKMGACL